MGTQRGEARKGRKMKSRRRIRSTGKRLADRGEQQSPSCDTTTTHTRTHGHTHTHLEIRCNKGRIEDVAFFFVHSVTEAKRVMYLGGT